MQAHGISDDARRDENGLKILHHHKNERDEEWMRPVSPLPSGDEDGGNPAKHDADIRNHGQDHDEKPDERCEIQAAHIKGGANENAVDQANEQLAAEVGDDVAVD